LTDKVKNKSSCVLRFFGADTQAIDRAAQALSGVGAQCASRGGETLLALRADTPRLLEKAEKRLRTAFKSDLYGEGEQTLPAALAAQLDSRGRLLACADTATGAMLEPRLEAVEGAERVFDFGAMSYAQAETRAKIEQRAARAARGKTPADLELARVRAALRVVGAELVAGSVKCGEKLLLIVGTRKGCWLRYVREDENPALWLMDMIRRAACGLKQAEGTSPQRYGAKIKGSLSRPAEQAAAKARPGGKMRVLGRAVFLLAALALVGLAGSWYVTGGDLKALPEVLGFSHQLHSGASLV